jgi:hypothetical protein
MNAGSDCVEDPVLEGIDVGIGCGVDTDLARKVG